MFKAEVDVGSVVEDSALFARIAPPSDRERVVILATCLSNVVGRMGSLDRRAMTPRMKADLSRMYNHFEGELRESCRVLLNDRAEDEAPELQFDFNFMNRGEEDESSTPTA